MEAPPKASQASELLSFIEASPTAHHAVHTVKQRLLEAGFSPLSPQGPRGPQASGRKHFLVRGGRCLAFILPEKSAAKSASPPALRLWGAHTDSPGLKLKATSGLHSLGYHQLAVEVYGGALTYSWLDRELGLAGTVYFEAEGQVREVLIHERQPLFFIPSLAIHLQKKEERNALKLNPETQLKPIFSLGDKEEAGAFFSNFLCRLLSEQTGRKVTPAGLLASELFLVPCESGRLCGRKKEFISAWRLDNLAMCHAGLSGLLAATQPHSASSEALLPCLFLSDHEEVGSVSSEGAASHFLGEALKQISAHLYGSGAETLLLTHAQTSGLFISADLTHGLHPNYPDRHDDNHRPRLNGGVALKWNANLRYITSGKTAAQLKLLLRGTGITLQNYTPRADLPCGSTIGPLVASHLSLPGVDLGSPVLGMHSVREFMGRADHEAACRLAATFFSNT